MSFYRPRPQHSPSASQPNQNPPMLLPLQPPMRNNFHFYSQMHPNSGYQPGSYSSQGGQNLQYLYHTPPPPPPPIVSPPIVYQPQNHSFLNHQPPLPPYPHPSIFVPPPPPNFPPPSPPPPPPPSPPPPPPPGNPSPPPPPPPENPPSPPPPPENPSLPPPPPPELQTRKTHAPYKWQVPKSIGDSQMCKRTVSLFGGERNRLRKSTSFVCKMKFRNELPDITGEPKFLPLKRDPDRYTRYDAKSEQKLWKPELYPEMDLGIPLDLLDLSVYNPPKGERLPLDPEDEELLRDDPVAVAPLKQNGVKRKERPDDKDMPWLIKTQHISLLSKKSSKQPLAKRKGKEVPQRLGGRNILKKLTDRDSKIKDIEASFEACKSLPIHSTDKNLKPVEVLPFLPDLDRYNDKFVVATFDSNPTADSEAYNKLNESARDACESKALMKSIVEKGSDSGGADKFLAYLAPFPEEMSKDVYNEEKDVSFSWVREYNYHVHREDDDDPKSYLVSFDDTNASYVPLPTRLKMRKKKASKGKPSKVVVRSRSIAAPVELKESEETLCLSKRSRYASKGHG